MAGDGRDPGGSGLGCGGAEGSQRAAARGLLGEFALTGRTPTGVAPLFEIGDSIQLPRRSVPDGG